MRFLDTPGWQHKLKPNHSPGASCTRLNPSKHRSRCGHGRSSQRTWPVCRLHCRTLPAVRDSEEAAVVHPETFVQWREAGKSKLRPKTTSGSAPCRGGPTKWLRAESAIAAVVLWLLGGLQHHTPATVSSRLAWIQTNTRHVLSDVPACAGLQNLFAPGASILFASHPRPQSRANQRV